jgi:hypothetical protein
MNFVFDTTHLHTHVLCFNYHRYTKWLKSFLDTIFVDQLMSCILQMHQRFLVFTTGLQFFRSDVGYMCLQKMVAYGARTLSKPLCFFTTIILV